MKILKLLSLLLFLTSTLFAQDWQFTPLADLPEPVSNNAVAAATVNGKQYVYSFSGIDSTKVFSGIHNKCWRLDVEANTWEVLPNLPDPMGKIAASVNIVKGVAYIIGGYHVFANGTELTSDKVHRFDLATNTYMPDGAPIPKPVDDQVQVVYKDSLIYLVTGWSGTQTSGSNVSNVQIYDPSNDNWQIGTSVPNNTGFKVFGSSGSLVDNKIFYFGGARSGPSFPVTSTLRIGVIDDQDPTAINWESVDTEFPGYRVASTTVNDDIYFLGGSDVTYNYNGIAYNNSGGVAPNQSALFVESKLDTIFRRGPFADMPMDLRSLGELSNTEKVIVGGMEANQKVSRKTWKLTFESVDYVSTKDFLALEELTIYPNPAQEYLVIKNESIKADNYVIYDKLGKLVMANELIEANRIDIETLGQGHYILVLKKGKVPQARSQFIKH